MEETETETAAAEGEGEGMQVDLPTPPSPSLPLPHTSTQATSHPQLRLAPSPPSPVSPVRPTPHPLQHTSLLALQSPLSQVSPRSAPHTPPSPVHRPIPLPPVTPYDTPSHTSLSSPMFFPQQSYREVSPLRYPGLGLPSQADDPFGFTPQNASLLHLESPVPTPMVEEADPPDPPQRSRSRSEPAVRFAPLSPLAPSASESAIDDSTTSSLEAPPAYTRHASGGDLSLPPFDPGPTPLVPLTLPEQPATYRPLDPPPECFSTPGPWRIKSRSFQPFTIHSLGRYLAQGWQAVYAPSLEAHGITQEDWGRFLTDLTHTAILAQNGISAVAPKRLSSPHAGFRSLLSGAWAVEGGPYDQAFRRSSQEEVQALVGVWNGSAWERRKVRCALRPVGGEGGRTGWELLVEAL
ncbi:hypothetical protein DACRYDRAFT_119072 [Dacryopinax primogenitus]|uniref:Uncharacterized protein n=1 Tax=Dacryopinax primogenitus (strain DJM 731) TaxID=1858805 RepID=M5FQN3_DACPD|nr:uncharacterized protein DACRYDRAFT_119072 [Dacryopinax primogenitus]EJT97853.1 hypothetical protein DACRYDRAFT_119072 [Dacryopinax primogenitus]